MAKRLGEESLLEKIRKDGRENGTPIKQLLHQIDKEDSKRLRTGKSATHKFLSGVYSDGLPWSGVIAEANTKKNTWRFNAYIAKNRPKNVPDLLEEYKQENSTTKKISLAWNGGYILNPELVGKLGLPTQYIGSPLGLLILNGEVKCPPLFNKPAFIIFKDGSLDIQKVNCADGFVLSNKGRELVFTSSL
ncbi:MAG: hypothetical protein IH948_04185 [Bacteroidetes bacterium]|nr:hypothetical protein [Bacteroidota bacterium]